MGHFGTGYKRHMANPVGKVAFKLVSIAVAIPVGIAARKGVEKLWTAARPGNPPRAAKDPDADWRDAIGWAALSAVGIAAAELASTKGASEVWRTLTGSEPPVKNDKDQEKEKQQKA